MAGQSIAELLELVSSVARRKNVIEFYIGRTVYLGNSQVRHGCDDIWAIYSTDSIDNAQKVEDYLIKKFVNHKKCSNKAADARGNFSDDGSYVYVAIWY